MGGGEVGELEITVWSPDGNFVCAFEKEIVNCRIFFTKFTWPKKNFQFELVESRFLEPSFFLYSR